MNGIQFEALGAAERAPWLLLHLIITK